ncbi:hypothetical protein ACQP2T_21200 [Nonomuraea sp. CA-143628]|uniref:hypothetical protein n=1 Tax=Nonomuraea sp. CA-143628 TaxID=3239997 RepID=UPI003D93B787
MPRPLKNLDPSVSPAHLLGFGMRLLREKRNVSDVAKTTLVDLNNIYAYERGDKFPSADATKRLDEHYDAKGFLIALRDLVVSVGQMAEVSDESDIGHAEDMDKVRRQLLAAVARLGVAVVLPVEELGNLRNLIDRDMGSSRLEEWEEIVWEYAHSLKTQPIDVISDLSLDVLDLQRVSRSAGDNPAGWARVNAQMQFLLARALGLAGQSRESRHWWNTARHSAEKSGDPQLAALCRGWESTHGLYEKRPATILLGRAEEAIDVAGGLPCAGVAEALTAQAQVRAMVGDVAGARESLNRQRAIFERLPDAVSSDTGSAFGWPVTRMLHTRSFVATYTNDADAAQAQREALEAYPPSDVRAIAQVKLYQAMAQVTKGDVRTGLDMARDAVTEIPADQHTMFTRFSATLVLRTVPDRLDARTRPAVETYRELLALPKPPEEGI